MADYNSIYTGAQIDEAVGRATGYGLGAEARSCADCNTAAVSGWYNLAGAANGPAEGIYGWMLVSSRSGAGGMIRQDVWGSQASPQHWVRYSVNGVWSAWEWVNPPMQLGVEYRTTERYWGRPVYTKVVNCGTMPASTVKTVDPEIENARNRIGVSAMMYYTVSDSWTLPLHTDAYDADVWFNNSGINIRTQQDGLTAYTCYATIKYTKTTD